MEFQKGKGLQEPGFHGAPISDPLQFFPQDGPICAYRSQGFFAGKSPCVHQAAHHIGRIPDPFFVGEYSHYKRMLGTDPLFLESLAQFDASQHPQTAVILTGIDHRIDVGPHHHGSFSLVFRRFPDAEDIPDPVHHYLEIGFLHPCCYLIPALPIGITGRQPDPPAILSNADFSQSIDMFHQTLSIDFHTVYLLGLPFLMVSL